MGGGKGRWEGCKKRERRKVGSDRGKKERRGIEREGSDSELETRQTIAYIEQS